MDYKLDYTLKKTLENVGRLPISVTCLDNLDRTIDSLFVELEKIGRPELLEELCPYFGVVWPSARALAEHLEEERPEPGRALELGCGLALPSLVLAKLWTESGEPVIATDYHPEVPRFLERNKTENSITNLEHLAMDWRGDQDKELPPALKKKFNLIYGSDLLYEREQPPILANAVQRLLDPSGRFLLTDPGRPYLQPFVDAMSARGFQSQTLSRTVEHNGKPFDVFLIEFSSRA